MRTDLVSTTTARSAEEGVQETLEVSELEVLKEIRDTLLAQRGGGAVGTGGAGDSGAGGPGGGCGALPGRDGER